MDQLARTPKQLGTALRRVRKQKGLTQPVLSTQTGKRQATISNLEIEGSGTLETLFSLLSALDLELVIRPRTKGESAAIGDIF
jgi:HTH-type transcriptional regulator/antitoxin HipB